MSHPRTVLCAAALFALLLAPPARSDEPKPTPKPDADRPHVTLTWSTASEVDNFGFFVMRGDDEKGPFKAVNATAIPGSGTSELPRDYRYQDFSVVMGKTYWYYLDAVSTSGVREKFSPVLKRLCCKLPGAAKVDEKPSPDAKPEPAREPKP